MSVMSGGGGNSVRRHADLRALGAILVVAAVMRFAGLGADPLWIDEARGYFGQFGRPLMREIRETFGPIDPPLSFLILHGMAALPLRLETALRIVPALAGLAEVLGVWAVLRLVVPRSRMAAPLGASLMALAPFAVRYSQEARYYTVASALELGGFVAAMLLARFGGVRAWLLWVAISVLAVYTHVLGWYWFGLQAMVLAALAVVPRWSAGLRPPRLRAIVAAGVVVVLGFLPWALYSAAYWLSPAASDDDPRVRVVDARPPDFGLDFLHRLAHGLVADASPEPNLLVFAVMACALLAPVLCRGTERRAALAMWAYLLVTVCLVSLLYRIAGTYFALRRYEFLLPILLCCAALGVVGIRGRLAAVSSLRAATGNLLVGGLVAAILGLSAVASVDELRRDKPDYRAVARAVEAAPADTVVVLGPFSSGPKTAWDPVLRRYLHALGVRREMVSIADVRTAHDLPAAGDVLWITGLGLRDHRFTVQPLNEVDELLTISGDASYGAIVTPVYLMRSSYGNRLELEQQVGLVERLKWTVKMWY